MLILHTLSFFLVPDRRHSGVLEMMLWDGNLASVFMKVGAI